MVLSGFTGPATAAQNADRDFLLNFLTGFLDGAAHNDPAIHERFWADDLVYTAPDGIRYDKAAIMANVRREGPHPISTDTEIYSARDIDLRLYGDAAVVNFTMVISVDVGETEIGHYLVSCVFIKQDGRWRTVNWHSTVDRDTTPSASFLVPD